MDELAEFRLATLKDEGRTTRSGLGFYLAILAAAIASVVFAGAKCRGEELRAVVTAVHDGDTFTVFDSAGLRVTIRLHGVDAPELKQEFGPEGKRYTADRLLGKQVLIETKGRSYRRIVGQVFVLDHVTAQANIYSDFNAELVRVGLAWQDRRYSRNRTVALAQADALTDRRGLWVDESPVAPWDFRNPTGRGK